MSPFLGTTVHVPKYECMNTIKHLYSLQKHIILLCYSHELHTSTQEKGSNTLKHYLCTIHNVHTA